MGNQRVVMAVERFIAEHDLMASWADGLGLRWSPQERQAQFHAFALRETLDLVNSGYSVQAACERACGIHRGDKRHEDAAASHAQAVVARGNQR